MVGTTGIEPVTPSMSTRCSPAELRARHGEGITTAARLVLSHRGIDKPLPQCCHPCQEFRHRPTQINWSNHTSQ